MGRRFECLGRDIERVVAAEKEEWLEKKKVKREQTTRDGERKFIPFILPCLVPEKTVFHIKIFKHDFVL